MKKLLLGTLALVTVAFVFLSFKNKSPKSSPPALVQATLNGIPMAQAQTWISNFAASYTHDPYQKSISAWYSATQLDTIVGIMEADSTRLANSGNPIDGIRFYFGDKDAPVTTDTPLDDLDILMVETKQRPKGTDPLHPSTHGDYYDHYSNALSVETGQAACNKAHDTQINGGTLYNIASPLPGACSNPSTHFLKGDLAYQMVQARSEYNSSTEDRTAYNTISEWYPYCFIHKLFKVIAKSNKRISGLRIYLGKGKVSINATTTAIRDVFILVPTYTVGNINADFANCLEDLAGADFGNCTEAAKAFLLPRIKIFKLHANLDDGSGYDFGELCPDNCP